MNLSKLSLISILACVIGLVVLIIVTVISAGQIQDRQSELSQLVELRERINEFSVASDNLVIFGADPGLWQAYRAEAKAISEALEETQQETVGAQRAANRIEKMVQFVGTAIGYIDPASGEPSQSPRKPLPGPAARERIIQQRVAGQGVALDTAINNLLRDRQRSIMREATRIVIVLAGGTLLFGGLCVAAFVLIHRRIARPARSISAVLDHVRSGHDHARATVSGNDELSELAQTLNRTLDERDAAHTELKQREERLRVALKELEQTRDRLLRAQSVAQIGSWDVDLSEGTLEWSDQVFEIFGISREGFDGTEKAFFELLHPNDREWFLERRARWLDEGGEFDQQHRIVRPDGNVRWVRERARIISDESGQPAFTTGTVQDVTDVHRMNEQLAYFQELLEGSEDLCAIIDQGYQYIWINRSYAQNHEVAENDCQGVPLDQVLGKDYFELIRPRLDRCFAGETQRFETTREIRGKGQRNLLVRYYPIERSGRKSRYAAAVITDITEMRSAEAEVSRRGRLLDMAGRAARFGAWSVDPQNNQIEWSDVVAEIHGMPAGYSPSVEEGIQFYAPEYRPLIRRRFEACVERGQPYDEELQIIDASGERRWVRAVGEAIHDDSGRLVRVQGAFQDISEWKSLQSETLRLNSQLASMLAAITDGFVAFDHEWRYTYVNAEAENILGKSSDDLIGTTVWSQFPDLAGTQTERALLRSMKERVTESAEEWFEPLDGWFEVRAYPWEGGVATFFRDVTESHRILEQVKAQEAALRTYSEELNAALNTRQALINSLPAHIAMLDADGIIVDVNEQWRHFGELNAFRGDDFGIGTNYIALCETASGECSDEAREVANGLREVLAGHKNTFALEYPCHSPDEERWFRVMFSRLAADEDKPTGAVAMHVDITERKKAEREINRLAYEDPLTGALSRNGFVQQLDDHIEIDGWSEEGIVAILDIVGQHDINDAHGYDIGDDLLIAVSKRLERVVGDAGVVGRTGGDEFAAYRPLGESQAPDTFLQEVENVVAAPFVQADDDIGIEIELRIGHTVLGANRRSAQELIREAELALFEHRGSSDAGLKHIEFTTEIKERAQQRIQLTRELKRALEMEEFELHFQPKVSLTDGRMISAEALIRWRHPERGLLSPGLFIPVAEQSQLIGPIGDWAIRAACRQLKDWQKNNLDAVRVAVNVSQVQFMLGDFSAKVRAALEEFDLAPQHLSLEITESVFERHSDRLLSQIRELHDMGVQLSLDDFGTGYSSLLYLQRYPFDEIKLDRGFVDHVLEDDYSRDIVAAVLNVSRALGAEVVAEGIESAEIAAALVEMGCAVGQGYYYSVPLEAEDFRWLLSQHSKLPLGS